MLFEIRYQTLYTEQRSNFCGQNGAGEEISAGPACPAETGGRDGRMEVFNYRPQKNGENLNVLQKQCTIEFQF